MRTLGIAILGLLMAGAVAETKTYPPDPARQLPNACVIIATNYEYELTARDTLRRHAWARLIRVDYGPGRPGHAICVFELRNHDLWAYDSKYGSNQLFTRRRDIASITYAMQFYDPSIRTLRFID